MGDEVAPDVMADRSGGECLDDRYNEQLLLHYTPLIYRQLSAKLGRGDWNRAIAPEVQERMLERLVVRVHPLNEPQFVVGIVDELVSSDDVPLRLLQRAVAGEELARHAVVVLLRKFIYRVVESRTRGAHVDDIACRVMLELYDKLTGLEIREGTPITALLHIIIRSRTTDKLRSEGNESRRRNAYAAQAQFTPPTPTLDEMLDVIREGKLLKEDQLFILERHLMFGASFKEIALETGRAVGTVHARFKAAHTKLMKAADARERRSSLPGESGISRSPLRTTSEPLAYDPDRSQELMMLADGDDLASDQAVEEPRESEDDELS